ncbi:hypothetical protein JHS3_15960 [Jeongeupia sp. HS-3]|uniref:alkaline phosphatase D family protein n=1 Tax=Jeongeupia sp. HS-3 TaxID=1009682 RepID=UPI0018A6539A|nr:alkaline phosphatase D family protein [Jeongeupia sp. HS-3]BCL75860.1 hypothetical protein JHS3_15960 [Jeongeupia sp. HS-3]
MDRRRFLKLSGFLTVSTVAGLLAGCGGDDATDTTVAVLPPDGKPTPAQALKFPQGIASGDPRADSIVLWTRAVPLGADAVASVPAAGDLPLRLIVTSDDMSALIGSSAVLGGKVLADVSLSAQAAWDHSVRHKLTGLNPATTYYYQFVSGETRSAVGRFKTAPAEHLDPGTLKFAFLSCQDWSINHWGGFDLLAAEDVDFVVHLGDYIYETVGEAFQAGAVEAMHAPLSLPDGPYKSGNSGARYANTLADYRALYKQYRSDPRLQQVHARFAMIAIWDDHEFSDDCWGDASTYDNGSYDKASGRGDNSHQTARRRGANQAWFEFMPADVPFDAAASGFQTIKLYRDFRFGSLMHLVMTDERLYRADHLIPEAAVGSSIGSRYLVPTAQLAAAEAQKFAAGTASGDPLAQVSVLGKTQREWWQSTLAGSKAAWKIWGNEVSLLRMRLDASKLAGVPAALRKEFVLNADQWDGFNAERKVLVGFLRQQKISDVVAITGDIHSFYAGVVYDDYATGAPGMVDLVTAGISSDSFYHYFYAAAQDPALAAAAPLVYTSEAGAEQLAIQMLSAAIAGAAGVSDLSDTAAVQAAVQGAIVAGKVSATAFQTTSGLAKTPINTFDDTVGGALGTTLAATMAALAGKSAAVATLSGLIRQQLAAVMGLPVASVPATEVLKRLNPFADQASGVAPVNNPWIAYTDTDAQGYAVVTLSAGELRAEFKKIARLDGHRAPAAPLLQTTRLQVPRGQVKVNRL